MKVTMSYNQIDLTEVLKTLIGFKTFSNDHVTNKKALNWIEKQIETLPLYTKMVSYNNFPSLLITTSKTKSPRLWLQAHLDVVPGTNEAFIPYIKDTKLKGRGSFDMKFAIASYIKLVHDFGPALNEYDFGIMITTDEEIGGANGVKALLDNGYSSQAVFLPDGGKNWQFVSASRGIWHIRIKAEGESQHGSRPWLGSNAIVNLIGFLTELSSLFPTEPCNTSNHFHDSINIGTIGGGEAVNQIPSEAQAQCDIRYLPEHHLNLKRKVAKIIKDHPLITLETMTEGEGYRVDEESQYFKIYKEILKNHGISPSFEITHGSSDARYFAAHNISPIVLRPVGGGHHSEEEWIDLNELKRFYLILRDFVTKTTGRNT